MSNADSMSSDGFRTATEYNTHKDSIVETVSKSKPF